MFCQRFPLMLFHNTCMLQMFLPFQSMKSGPQNGNIQDNRWRSGSGQARRAWTHGRSHQHPWRGRRHLLRLHAGWLREGATNPHVLGLTSTTSCLCALVACRKSWEGKVRFSCCIERACYCRDSKVSSNIGKLVTASSCPKTNGLTANKSLALLVGCEFSGRRRSSSQTWRDYRRRWRWQKKTWPHDL